MLKINDNVGALVATETKEVLRALDDAILSELRLCTTLVEAFDEAQIPVSSSQKLLQSMSSGIKHMVAGRAEMAQAVRELNAIKTGSNLRETSYNCPNGIPPASGSALGNPRVTCKERALA